MAPPTLSTVPLTSQVGGHIGVQSSEDGFLIIKPALPLELQFYQSAISDPGFEPLRPFIPKFYGTLKLEGRIDTKNTTDTTIAITPIEDAKAQVTESLVLENLTHSFLKPNILDIKLGTVLYDEAASPEKIARMTNTARHTTSLETGIRLTGFQVYDYVSSQPIITPKSYGKSIKPSDLPDGIARFFPLAPASDTHPPALASTTGLPRHLLLPILHAIRADIGAIRNAFQRVHLRMAGGSILIAYEADWEKTLEGLKTLEARSHGEEEHEGEDEGYNEDGDGDGDDYNDEDDEDSETDRPGPPYIVKLIDFAHTRIKPGEGPDEGVLTGLDTISRLLDGRIEQVRNAVI